MRLVNIEPCEKLGHAMVLYATEGGMLVQIRSCDMPAIDAVPVVHGRWVERTYGEWYCTRCGYEIEGLEYHPSVVDYNFCPKCGMKDGE